jgi:hypothetical protein
MRNNKCTAAYNERLYESGGVLAGVKKHLTHNMQQLKINCKGQQ